MLRKYLVIVVSVLLSLSACQELDLVNPSTISSDDVWKDPKLIEMYVNHLYIYLPGWDVRLMNNISDEARNNYTWNSANKVIVGEWNDTSNPMDNWAHSYKYIRVANDFLKDVVNASVSQDVIKVTSAEVRFIRALFYFNLVKRYGGVPLITMPQTLDEDLEVPRNSLDECINFIINETDAIVNDLPKDAARGKITKGAALALKTRVLLYAASPLYNTANDASKWQKAADAAKAVIDLNKYDLYPDIKRIWLDKSDNHKEAILERQYQMPNASHGWDCAVKTLDLANGDAGNCSPLQELIDAFPMKNGKHIDEAGSGYDPQNPYVGRDDRFYANIGYNQAVVSGVQGGVLNKNYVLQIYKGGNDFDFPSGNPAYQDYTTYTGYFTIKAVDPDNTEYRYGGGSVQPWIEFRYAEVLLNYAEALNEIQGPSPAIYDALNKVRKRAGIAEDLQMNHSKEQLRDLIRNERYVELCFEQHRYWDLRRWKVADQVLNGRKYTGVVITKEEDGTFSYDYQPVEAQNLVFETKMYFMPIPMSELSKNGKLEQNPGW
ncbi:RagB/SusD family nutrient uptake outer membrane protein [Parabacteroides sp. OttesenSCG-928-G06]|nr:RagB/SusD family nutrient uptake outer membrane protein [Parabacteroides sp. OttesenSCG-928-K15]MDL2282438.1 RagB/SusD family nutrient uptake outer membrane protein [Parabacteroides sp. OttesenSCG-928-G06]